MNAILLTSLLLAARAIAEEAPAPSPGEAAKLSELQKKVCSRHLEVKNRDILKSDCRANYPELGKTVDELKEIFQASYGECLSTVKYEEENSREYRELLRGGADQAEQIGRSLEGQTLTQAQLMDKQHEALLGAARSFRDQNLKVRDSFKHYRTEYLTLKRLERRYGDATNKLGYGESGGGLCPGGERDWIRGYAVALDQETTALRKRVAKNLQELNAAYQKNLVAAGASKDQAVQAAQSMARLSDEGLDVKASEALKIEKDGSISGAEKHWYESIIGTSSPHDKEWARVNCPEGSDAPACYDRLYKARTSRLDDEALRAFTGDGELPASASDENLRPSDGHCQPGQEGTGCNLLSPTKLVAEAAQPEPVKEEAPLPPEVTRPVPPAPALAAQGKLPGHGKAGVSDQGGTEFYNRASLAAATSATEPDPEGKDDGFSLLYLNGRNSSYYKDGAYRGLASSDDVATLQRNINIVFASNNLEQRVGTDGKYGKETQSALDYISNNPAMRAALLARQRAGH